VSELTTAVDFDDEQGEDAGVEDEEDVDDARRRFLGLDRSPTAVCMRWCLCRSNLRANRRPQPGNTHSNGLSPLQSMKARTRQLAIEYAGTEGGEEKGERTCGCARG
jgi:hypothetical protein